MTTGYKYSVWVGGAEVNDYYLTKKEASEIAEYWKSQGYDEVQIEKISDNVA